MISADALDGLLTLVAAIWIALSITIVADRYRYDRRMRRAQALQARLRLAPSAAATSAKQISADEFQDLILSGLPPEAETAIAQQIAARNDDRALRRLAEGSTPANARTRILALQMIVSSRHRDAYYVLDRCLRSRNRDLAAAAIRMLVRLDDERSAEILVGGLRDRVFPSSRMAAAIERLSVSRTHLLGPLLDARHTSAVFWGVRLAGRLRAVECLPRVRELTAAPDPRVRRAAVEALGSIGEPQDRLLLLTRFVDPVPMVRLHAARAVAAFPAPAVADALAELLRDREWIVRAAAREALRRLGDVGTPSLLRVIWEDDEFAANSAAEVLFLTGAALEMARRLLIDPDDDESRRTVRRFIATGGPHLRRALLDQIAPDEATQLMVLLGPPGAAEAQA